MQRSATSCFAKHIAAFLVRPFGEYPAFLVLTALLPLVPDIIRFFLNEMSFVPGRNLFYGTLLSLFRAWLLVLPLCLRQHDRGGGPEAGMPESYSRFSEIRGFRVRPFPREAG